MTFSHFGFMSKVSRGKLNMKMKIKELCGVLMSFQFHTLAVDWSTAVKLFKLKMDV